MGLIDLLCNPWTKFGVYISICGWFMLLKQNSEWQPLSSIFLLPVAVSTTSWPSETYRAIACQILANLTTHGWVLAISPFLICAPFAILDLTDGRFWPFCGPRGFTLQPVNQIWCIYLYLRLIYAPETKFWMTATQQHISTSGCGFDHELALRKLSGNCVPNFSKPDNSRLSFSDLTISNMCTVRHLGFERR